jgi:hypothetical protein
VTVKIELPPLLSKGAESGAIANVIAGTAKALKIDEESEFWCAHDPEWKRILRVLYHHCSYWMPRVNWKAGYQDIERTWLEVDRVYATRYDCRPVPERVRQAA